ncbi:MAG: glycosyltransferase family 9 protein [Planctomycetes bacterium]|nr:glycosyltransferase family 9 protein [Planctomycetota bacterium]
MTRLLVLRRGGLGDTLLTAPLLRALRRLYPDADLHLAGVREHVDVLCGYGVVDVAHSSEAFPLWSPAEARRRFGAYELVLGDEPELVDRAFDPRAWVTGTPFALQLARQVGLEPLWPGDAQLLPPRAAGEGPVALAPGSGGVAKCWPREHWPQLAAAIGAAGREVLVVTGPVEAERDDPRGWRWPVPVRFVVEPTPLALARRLEDVGAFVGNDSGTTHLAAMLGVPTLALFVATDPSVWAPVGAHVRWLGGPGAAPTVTEVFAEVQR